MWADASSEKNDSDHEILKSDDCDRGLSESPMPPSAESSEDESLAIAPEAIVFLRDLIYEALTKQPKVALLKCCKLAGLNLSNKSNTFVIKQALVDFSNQQLTIAQGVEDIAEILSKVGFEEDQVIDAVQTLIERFN